MSRVASEPILGWSPKALAVFERSAQVNLRIAFMALYLSVLSWQFSSSVVCAQDIKAKASASSSSTSKGVAEDRSSRDTALSKGDLTFDDIKFDIEKDGKFTRDMLTKQIEGLDKKTIRIRGYMLPASIFQHSGIEQFVLVRDNMECCFGPGAALYDCIMVYMAKGKTADFTTKPVAVRGKFEIEEFKYPGTEQHYAIYKLTATEVK